MHGHTYRRRELCLHARAPEFTISELPRFTASTIACCSADGGGIALAECTMASWAARNDPGCAGIAGAAVLVLALAATDDAIGADGAVTAAGHTACAHSRFIPHAAHAGAVFAAPKSCDMLVCVQCAVMSRRIWRQKHRPVRKTGAARWTGRVRPSVFSVGKLAVKIASHRRQDHPESMAAASEYNKCSFAAGLADHEISDQV